MNTGKIRCLICKAVGTARWITKKGAKDHLNTDSHAGAVAAAADIAAEEEAHAARVQQIYDQPDGFPNQDFSFAPSPPRPSFFSNVPANSFGSGPSASTTNWGVPLHPSGMEPENSQEEYKRLHQYLQQKLADDNVDDHLFDLTAPPESSGEIHLSIS